jgi:GDP-D-mannose dehydratase
MGMTTFSRISQRRHRGNDATDAIDAMNVARNRRALLTGRTGQDGSMLARLLAEIKPDELDTLRARSHVGVSFDRPGDPANVRRCLGGRSMR